jgi:hypothetical protein
MNADSERRAAIAYVALLFLSLYLLTLKGVSTADDLMHYDLVQSFVGSGCLHLPPGKYDPETHPGMDPFVARGRGGHVYLGLPNGLALASVPLGGLGRIADLRWSSIEAADPLAQGDEDGFRAEMAKLRRRPSALLTAATNPVASAITVALFFALAMQLGGSVRDALRVTLLLGVATVVWPYSTNYWTQPIAGLFLFTAFYAIAGRSGAVGWRRALAAGLLAGAAFLCRFEMLALAPWLLIYCIACSARLTSHRFAAAGSFLVGLGAVLASQAAWNAYRFGNWLQMGTGHQRLRDFGGDVVRVLPLEVISPYRGILLYSPALVLGIAGVVLVWRRAPALAVTVIGVSATALVLYSAFVMWRSDVSWGPRFLVPVTPFLLLPATLVVRKSRAAFWTALILGIGIQLPAALGIQDLFVLSAFHAPTQHDPWQHFWQSDVVPQWTHVLHGNVELWWLASPARALLALPLGIIGTLAAWKLRGVNRTA